MLQELLAAAKQAAVEAATHQDVLLEAFAQRSEALIQLKVSVQSHTATLLQSAVDSCARSCIAAVCDSSCIGCLLPG